MSARASWGSLLSEESSGRQACSSSALLMVPNGSCSSTSRRRRAICRQRSEQNRRWRPPPGACGGIFSRQYSQSAVTVACLALSPGEGATGAPTLEDRSSSASLSVPVSVAERSRAFRDTGFWIVTLNTHTAIFRGRVPRVVLGPCLHERPPLPVARRVGRARPTDRAGSSGPLLSLVSGPPGARWGWCLPRGHPLLASGCGADLA